MLKPATLALVGKRFGLLTVIKVFRDIKNYDYPLTRCKCKCDCGKMTITTANRLRRNETKSCGHLVIEKMRQTATKHGHAAHRKLSPEYRSWLGIQRRCNYSGDTRYQLYGGRGIKCLWKSFEEFYKDMGNKPTPKHSIERINNDGHYCKENCRWATNKEQANNRSTNHRITRNGTTLTISQWSDKTGVAQYTLCHHANRGTLDKVFFPLGL